MAPRPAWTLIVEDRFGTVTEEYVFDAGELVIGRSRQSDVVLPSENVSRSHARLFVESGRLFIEDVGSSNGIWSDGRRIEGRLEIGDGDSVRVGDFQLRIRGGKEAAGPLTVHARLVGCSPGAMDQTYEIGTATTLVGRGRDCGLVLVDPSVSRVHSRLLVRPDGAVLVEDVGSANGLFVNGTKVKVWQLSGGDRVRFGNVEFLVEIPDSGTIQFPAVQGPSLRRRLKVALPAAVGLTLLAALVALAAIVLPGLLVPAIDGLETAIPDAGPPPPPVPAPPVRTAAMDLETARALMTAGRLDEARDVIADVLVQEPGNAEAIRLTKRLDVEAIAVRTLSEADRALQDGRVETAVDRLLEMPLDSSRVSEARVRLLALRPVLSRQRDDACSGARITSVACIRLRAQLVKVEAAVR